MHVAQIKVEIVAHIFLRIKQGIFRKTQPGNGDPQIWHAPTPNSHTHSHMHDVDAFHLNFLRQLRTFEVGVKFSGRDWGVPLHTSTYTHTRTKATVQFIAGNQLKRQSHLWQKHSQKIWLFGSTSSFVFCRNLGPWQKKSIRISMHTSYCNISMSRGWNWGGGIAKIWVSRSACTCQNKWLGKRTRRSTFYDSLWVMSNCM